MKTAILLIAHGSRQEEANADLHHVVNELRQRCAYDLVEASFLELAEPDIAKGAACCIAQGAERVILVPYFLSAGIHVRQDLLVAQKYLAERYPHIVLRLAEPLGRHPLLLDIVVQRVCEATGDTNVKIS